MLLRMRVAVTGGAGFIGRHTVAALEDKGHEVITIDRAHGVDLLEADLVEAFNRCESVIHLAGVLGTSELFDSVKLAIDVNMGGTARVLDAAVRVGSNYVGITMPPVFPSVYTATKVGAGRLAGAYHNAFGLPVTHVRAFNAYGPDQAVGPGHPQKIVPTFAYLSWRKRPMPIWGDGSQAVDLVHVDHIADCLVQAAEMGEGFVLNDPFGSDNTYDAGTGKSMTVLEVAHLVAKVTGCGLVEFLPMRSGEIPQADLHATEPPPIVGYGKELDRFTEAVEAYR